MVVPLVRLDTFVENVIGKHTSKGDEVLSFTLLKWVKFEASWMCWVLRLFLHGHKTINVFHFALR